MAIDQTRVSGQEILARLKVEYPNIFAAFQAISQEQFELFAKKHLDYGMTNVTAGEPLDTPESVQFALNGLWYRMNDKMCRWKTHVKGGTLTNENIQDTFQDIVNYAIIAQMIAQGKWVK